MANANPETMAIVAEIFAAFPGRFRFTSGIRTRAQNAAAGGVAHSYHLTGQAADFVAINGHYPPGELEAIGAIVRRHGHEVIRHNAGSGVHYHIEPAGGLVTSPTVANNVQTTRNGVSSISPALVMLGVFVIVFLITD